MGMGAYDEEEQSQDNEVDLSDTGEGIDRYDGELDYGDHSTEELLETFDEVQEQLEG